MLLVDGRRLGGAALAVLLMAGAGAVVGWSLAEEPPATVAVDPAPVAAAEPAYPQDREVRILPDPAYPPLGTGLPTSPEVVGAAPFQVALPVPTGWERSEAAAGETRFYPEAYSDEISYTYFVRVRFVAAQHLTAPTLVQDRIDALSSASAITGFELHSRSYDALVASYTALAEPGGDEGHRRVTMEQFVTPQGSDTATVSVSVIGREVDREGLAQLLDRLVDGLEPV